MDGTAESSPVAGPPGDDAMDVTDDGYVAAKVRAWRRCFRVGGFRVVVGSARMRATGLGRRAQVFELTAQLVGFE